MTDLHALDAAELMALEVRTTCEAVVDGTLVELLVYWLDLGQVLEEGHGQVVDPETGVRHELVWDPESGYAGRAVA